MKTLYSAAAFCFLIITACFTQDQSHYEAARELMNIVQQQTTEEFIDTIIQRIVTNDSTLAEHSEEIQSLIRHYLHTPDYSETRIKIIMNYFSAGEIRDICRILENPSFHNATKKQMALVKRYEKMFKKFEALFIDYVHKKLKKKY